MTLFIGMVFTIPIIFMQKKSIPENSTFSIHIYKLDEKNLWIENTTKISRGKTHSVLIIYPTPKASQNEKILNYHALLDMLLLLQDQIEIQKVYH